MKFSKENTGIVIAKAFNNDEFLNIDVCIFYVNKDFLLRCKETIDNIKDDFFSLEYFANFGVEFFDVEEELQDFIEGDFDWAFLDEEWYKENKNLFLEPEDQIVYNIIRFYKDGDFIITASGKYSGVEYFTDGFDIKDLI
jgi:hypothetical protein